jgi:hypothetical protein
VTREEQQEHGGKEARHPIPRRLSEELAEILTESTGHPITIEELERRLQKRGFALFIFLLSAPFIIPTPGLSVPFGIAISLLGLRILVGQRPQLPRFILQKQISHATLERMLNPILRFVGKLEKRIKPRLPAAFAFPGAMNLLGLGIVSGGFILSLPLPIPFSNGLPAVSIMALSAGLMERDGWLVIWGYVFGLLSWLYLAFWWGLVSGVLMKTVKVFGLGG